MDTDEHVLLSSLTTFRVGGPARYVITVRDIEKLSEAVDFAKSKKLPIFVIGKGSNLLVSDDPFNAVVIKIAEIGVTNGVEYKNIEENDNDCLVIANAGENWDALVADTVSRGLGGLENLSLIPGSVGAGPVQNIGAYGSEISDVLEWVEIFDTGNNGRGQPPGFRRLEKSQCDFGYRSSIFKKPAGKNFIITKVALRLRKNSKPNISYKDLKKYFADIGISEPTIQEVRNAVVVIRKRKLPDPDFIANAGSFFKNPVITESHASDLRGRFPDIPVYPAGEGLVKVSAAWIIDHICGLSHASSGEDAKVSVYEHQPLVIVNRANATFKEIKNFSEMIKLIVKEKTKINLELEVELVNEKIF